jgi:hypothetical protein
VPWNGSDMTPVAHGTAAAARAMMTTDSSAMYVSPGSWLTFPWESWLTEIQG